jgi:hypothetical protein
MKLEKNYAPGTIRKRIGALSRTWTPTCASTRTFRSATPEPPAPRRGRVQRQGRRRVRKLGKEAKEDVVRERRFSPRRVRSIIRALAGEKREDRERPLELKEADALRMLFLPSTTAVSGFARPTPSLPEQIDMRRRVLKIRTSKQWYGRVKMRRCRCGRSCTPPSRTTCRCASSGPTSRSTRGGTARGRKST